LVDLSGTEVVFVAEEGGRVGQFNRLASVACESLRRVRESTWVVKGLNTYSGGRNRQTHVIFVLAAECVEIINDSNDFTLAEHFGAHFGWRNPIAQIYPNRREYAGSTQLVNT
jgi:hypothetical protein